jgi:branched-chain amino acid transport system substrate-binding protein
VFGKYSFDENGDITLTPYGVYRIEDGAMTFERSVEPQL